MPSGKIYNLEFLNQYTSLNTAEGVGEYGMTRTQYFGELSQFEERVRPVLERLLDKRSRREVINDLNFLTQCLFSVCDTTIVPQIEDALALIRNKRDDYVAISDKIFEVYKLLRRLCEFIALAEIGKDQPVLEAFDENSAEKKGMPPDAKSEAKPGEEPPVKPPQAAAGTQGRYKILAIDDMPDVLTTIKVMLMYKFNVYGVTNSKAAFKFINQTMPDLILLDIEMPDINGIDLLKEIRRLPGCEELPILFLTSEANIRNIKEALSGGGNDFIRKPVEKNMLISRIEKYLKPKTK